MSLVRRRDFRFLLVGQTVSGLGDWMATVAFMALVLDLTGSSAEVGVILVLRLAPAAIAGPLTTRVVSRWNRRRTMLAMDLARAAVVAVVPLVAAVWWVYLWAFVLEIGGLIFLPARDATIPELAGGDELPLANGLVMASSYGTIPLGAGAFAVIAALFSSGHGHSTTTYWAVFGIDAATFLISFAMIWRIREFHSRRFEASTHEHHGSFVDALRLPEVRTIGPVAVVTALGLGALFSSGIVFVRDVLGASNADFSLLIALFGAGAGGGLALVRSLRAPRLTVVRWALAAQGLVIAGMSFSPDVGVALVGAVLFGAATTTVLTSAMSELQERLDGQERVMGLAAFHVATRAGLGVSAVAAGVIADQIRTVQWPLIGHLPPARVVLLVSGLVVVGSAGLLSARRTTAAEIRHR